MGFELRSTLQLQSGAETKELPFSFLWERKGLYLASLAVATVALWDSRPPAVRSCKQNYLRSACSYELIEVERRLPLRRAKHLQLPKADPLPSACSC